MDDYLKSLENEFKDILSSKKEDVSNKKTEGKKMEGLINKENTPFLWIGAAVLVVVTWFNYQSKINNQYVDPQSNGGSTEIVQSTPPWYKNNSEQKEAPVSADEKVETLKLAVQKIWDRTKWNTDRTILLSIVGNNNSYVLKNNYPKSELIFLNSDWTINKMPTVLNLDEADKEFLKQFVKP
jgi:hypothetical protein